MNGKPDGGYQKNQLIALGVLIAIGAAILIYYLVPSAASIESLTETALNGAPQEQIVASQELSKLGEPALAALLEVGEKSKNPDVLSVCIMGISRHRYYDGMEVVLGGLASEEESVRQSASTSLTKLLGRNFHFPVTGEPDQRASAIEKIREDWELLKNSDMISAMKKREQEKDSERQSEEG